MSAHALLARTACGQNVTPVLGASHSMHPQSTIARHIHTLVHTYILFSFARVSASTPQPERQRSAAIGTTGPKLYALTAVTAAVAQHARAQLAHPRLQRLMGVSASACCGGGPTSRRLTLLCIGLDGGGKSTLLSALGNPAELDPPVVPTVGFSQPTHKRLWGYDVTIYDLGGGARIRGVWPHYFADVHGVVYVVDAADSKRMTEAAEELQSALLHPMIVGKPLLVYVLKKHAVGMALHAVQYEWNGRFRYSVLVKTRVAAGLRTNRTYPLP